MSTNFPTDPLEAARAYMAHGFMPIPLSGRLKYPTRSNWGDERYAPEDARKFAGVNTGLMLGKVSNGLTDVDLDSSEAIRAAGVLLPRTGMVSGRKSARMAHYFYRCDPSPVSLDNLTDPLNPKDTKGKLLELRTGWNADGAKGQQTMVAPSVHPDTGEIVFWEEFGEPAVVSAVDLTMAVKKVAAAALLGRYWPKNSRHDSALALAGGLLRAWDGDEARVSQFVEAVVAAAEDDELRDRLAAVRDTAKDLAAGKEKVTGWPKLANLLGERGNAIVSKVREWLDIKDDPKVTSTFGKSAKSGVGYRPLPPFQPFPVAALPAPWAAFVTEGARVLKCDPAYVALPAIAVLAGAVGMTRKVYLGGEWYEPAVWWTAIIGDSGTRKSPAAELSAKLVLARQKKLLAEYREALKTFQEEYRAWKAKARGRNKDDAGDEPERPLLKRVVVSDVTIEKLAGLLDDNGRGLTLYRDELAGWVGSFAKYKGKSDATDEPNWLSVHRADAIIYDRKTGEKTTVFVPHAAVSVLGGIQPGKVKRMLAGLMDSGFAARIVMAMPPGTPKEYIDDAIPDVVKAAAEASLNALYDLRADLDEDQLPKPVVVKLAPDAKRRWRRFVNEWGRRQFEADGDLAAALSKLEGYAARFALIHHLTEANGDESVGLASLEAGIAVAEWSAGETARIYRMFAESDEDGRLRKLAESVTRLASKPAFGGRITARDLQRSRGCTAAEAEGILEALVTVGVGHWQPGSPTPGQGGKALAVFVLNPTPDMPDFPDMPKGESDPPDEDGGGGDPDMPPDMPTADSPNAAANDTTSIDRESGCDARSESPPEEQVGEVGHVGCRVEQEADGTAHPEPSAVSGSGGGLVGFTVIDRTSDLASVIKAVQGSEQVGLDIETTALNPRAGKLRLLQLATAHGTFVVDCLTVDPAPLFDAMGGAELVGHNLAFELSFLMPRGFAPGRLFDTMLASQVLDAGDRTVRHKLADLGRRHLGEEIDKTEQRSDWAGPLTDEQLRYAARDAELPLRLYPVLTAKLADAKLTATADLENRALPAVAWMGRCGVLVDRAGWEALAATAEADAARLAGEMDLWAPTPVGLFGSEPRNWNSTDEVKAAFRSAGVTLESTDDDTLATVTHPLGELLRDYRSAVKRTGTYGRTWLERVADDGRVSPSWNQNVTATGRMSCSNPNLQNLPRDRRYRRCFVAPPGRVLVKADYSQIELRIAAVIAGDAAMIAAYRTGQDLHRLTAAAVLGKPVEAVTTDDRQLAKAVNFGLLYGGGAAMLVRYAKAGYGVTMTEDQARGYRAAFFRQWPGLKRWHDRQSRAVVDTRTRGGRRRSGVGKFTEKTNTPVQGTAADGMKAALALLWDRRHEHPTAFPVLAVHDEIVVECDAADAEAVKTWLTRAMTDGMKLFCDPVPVEVEATIAPTWGG